jgi:hypothetical protein
MPISIVNANPSSACCTVSSRRWAITCGRIRKWDAVRLRCAVALAVGPGLHPAEGAGVGWRRDHDGRRCRWR